MIAAIINNIASDIRYMVISAAVIWLVIGSFVKNPKPRKILAPLHVLSTTAYLAFTFYLKYQSSSKFFVLNFFLFSKGKAFYPLLSQICYFLLLAPGSKILNLGVLEAINICFWWLFYANASNVLQM